MRVLVEHAPRVWTWERVARRNIQPFLMELARAHAAGPPLDIRPLIRAFRFRRDGLAEAFQCPHRLQELAEVEGEYFADCDDWGLEGAAWAMQQGLPVTIEVLWRRWGGHVRPRVLGRPWDLSGYRQTGAAWRGRQFMRVLNQIKEHL